MRSFGCPKRYLLQRQLYRTEYVSVFLQRNREIFVWILCKNNVTSQRCQAYTYPRKRVYECPSWRTRQRQHRKHHQALGSKMETKMMIDGSPYWSITPMDQTLMGRPCWQFLAVKAMWPLLQNIKILLFRRRAAVSFEYDQSCKTKCNRNTDTQLLLQCCQIVLK